MILNVDHLRSWIGRSERREERLTPSLVERFAATLELDVSSVDGSVAPQLIHLCLALPATPMSQLGEDGHPCRGGFLPPVPLPRRMWAGGAFQFYDDIRIGDTVRRDSVIHDVTVKQGRTGTLCFVTVQHKIFCGERHVIDERHDIVYRDIDTAASAMRSARQAAASGQHRKNVIPSAALLFRYSALTFNGHRIHYDAPYVRDIEHYPGLVVHGPLQATMLVHFARAISGMAPARFEFRSLSPLFDNAEFTLNAAEDGDRLKLWTATEGGPVAMEADAGW